MSHEEKLKAFEKYRIKQDIIGRGHMVDGIFYIEQDKITINIERFAESQGQPESLVIPDFVEKIR